MVRLLLPLLGVLMLWSGASGANEPTPYLLSPGDRVMISVWQEDTLRQETTVLPDGSITFPLVGRVDVVGLDATGAAQRIGVKLKEYLAEPNVSVVVINPAGNVVYVQGKVVKSGPVSMAGPTAVLQALSMSGGLDKFADVSDIKVIRGQGSSQKVLPVRYKDLVSGRDLSTNFQLQAGDTLVVP
ncbi:polysaccharide biosynthesis/export family protein [Pseudomonas entomophila]|uniref:polysaccharide biosynthesis/export family protein n=1 Tax=Pseudomonas entomophila TaxID=312306 RepID=UPI00200FA88B|nr:polysaccharide biosynthesis/export family protein [Pseudomonas entomophila]